MLSKWLRKLDEGTDLDEEEFIFAQIRNLATEDPKSFILEVRTLSGERWSSLSDIYEALSYQPAAWHSFYLEEFDRLLDRAREVDDPRPVLAPLDVFYLLSLDDSDVQFNLAIQDKLFVNLDDKNELIRGKCAMLLGDFTDRYDFETLDKLEEAARADASWRVRYYAWQTLNEINPERAERVKLPLWIRMRARMYIMD